MGWRWLLLTVAILTVSADTPKKEVSYEKPIKEPTGDYLKVEIRGTLEIGEKGDYLSWLFGKHLVSASIRPAPPDKRGRPMKSSLGWDLSLEGDKELQSVVRKLKGRKVVVCGVATQTGMGMGMGLNMNWGSAETFWPLKVTSLRATDPVAKGGATENEVKREDQPFLALWERDSGFRRAEAPYLRFAIWNDGRVLYAKDPSKWSHDLRRGKISPSRVARLKAALADTEVFGLKGTCYLVPDAPVDCLIIALGGKQQQMLYWDEVETPGHGINAMSKPHHLEFKRCWKIVNHLGLVALPDDGEAVKERIRVPQDWYLKEAIQSE